MSEKPPDFAMQRAVEILANIYERQHQKEHAPPPPADKPILMFSESLALDVNTTTKVMVERQLGIAFSYPTRGWHTYGVRGRDGARLLLSIFYSKQRLASAELYLPKVDRAPKLEPQDAHFRLIPGEIEVGMQLTALPEHFGHMAGMPTRIGPYAEMFEARFPGGAAYAMGNDGVIERLALYTLRE
ncbi:MAG TPA: hypothetical protein VMF11_13300 [Candidatus Baltobacteraceae bacterium]|nr:hypothetical protein [Candidatus Baltobacteraceae bacterium]